MNLNLNPSDVEACQARLRKLVKCECCSRHQKDKPTDYKPLERNTTDKQPLFKKRLSNTPSSGCLQVTGVVNQSVGRCTCNCRHLARLICRGHPDTQPRV